MIEVGVLGTCTPDGKALAGLDAFIAGESPRKRGRDRAVERQRDHGVEEARVDKARLLRLSGRAREALLEMEKLPADRRDRDPEWLIELARTSADLGESAESRKSLLAAKDAVRYEIDHVYVDGSARAHGPHVGELASTARAPARRGPGDVR